MPKQRVLMLSSTKERGPFVPVDDITSIDVIGATEDDNIIAECNFFGVLEEHKLKPGSNPIRLSGVGIIRIRRANHFRPHPITVYANCEDE